ncbi:hypothetical protein X772_27680 [Mesorhizobium sp. LSJC280B00]|nr:hypothetical protein X772_27680 [Mesorhizobium sp. LSJC280B00]
MLPCEAGFDRVERFLFSAFIDAAIDKYKRNYMRGCI